MTVFKVGDKVKQSPESEWRHNTAINPVDVEGEVVEVNGGRLGIRVEWPHGNRNVYSAKDLQLVKFDVILAAKQLHDLREEQAQRGKEINELAEKVAKALEGTGLVLAEDAKKAEPVTLLALEVAGDIEIGQQFMCNVSDHPSEHVVGKIYEVIDLDRGDSMPVKLQSEDGYGWWLDVRFLQNYTLVS